jgi:hypothetical protein
VSFSGDGRTESVKQQLSRSYNEKVKRNMAALESIVKTLILCGRQNLAIRGKTDDRSNFMALLEFRAEHDVSLREHMKSAPNNSQYLSHRIQNELIHLIGVQLQETILRPCREAPFFSLIIDETTDVSVKEQVSFIILFVSSDGLRHEEFIGFEETADTTGETLFNLVCRKLENLGLDMSKLVGLGFDGAANMSGKVKGLQARISAKVPTAQYVHCRAHCLNLAIMHCCREPMVRNLYSIVSEVVKFISNSPKRSHVYMSVDPSSDRLKRFCPTRWGRHEETLHRFLDNISTVVNTLNTIFNESSDRDSACKAQGFLGAILSFQFLITLVVVKHYMAFTKPLSLSLQEVDMNLMRAAQECSELINFLKAKRSDETVFASLFDTAVELATKLGVEVNAPRNASAQRNRSNAPSRTTAEYYIRNLHHPFLDHLIEELTSRIGSCGNRVHAQLLLPENVRSISHSQIEVLKSEYSHFIDLSDFDSELEMWKWKHSESKRISLQECIRMTQHSYPNLNRIFSVLLTMPVTSSSAERSFSALKRLKSYMRSTTGADRLTSLALLHIHPEKDIDIGRVLKAFDQSGHRRISIAFS